MKAEYKTENDLLQLVEEPQLDLFLENKFVGSTSNQEEIDSIIAYYQEFESKYPIKVINRKQFNTPVNFKQAKLFPRHRWYTYKEGFSPQFVEDFINRFTNSSKDVVFDPFGGIGTTVLQSSMLGYQSFSNDINPLSNYVALVKTDTYTKKDIAELKLSFESLIQSDLKLKAKAPINETVTSYFTSEILESILKIQIWISSLKSNKIKNLK